jgi:colanic acid biosynthesis glycosyl transferase WcaI
VRIAVHDFAGHPFQVQLSRELARRGHPTLHLCLRDLPGPKGPLEPSPADPPGFVCAPLSLGRPLEKYSLLKRCFAQREYSWLLARRIRDFQADVVLSANTPIDVQHYLLRDCQARGVGFVHWMQDLYCRALRTVLRRKLGYAGVPLAAYFDHLERRVCERSDAVVFITEDFQAYARQERFRIHRAEVIENWAPLHDIVPVARRNPWSRRFGFDDKLVLLYSGTLGLKHKPELLFQLAAALEDKDDAVVVVVSEGLGRTYLEAQLRRSPLKNLVLMDFQPYAEMSHVLGSADILLAILENDASTFAVPSKVLSYLCAGRPVLLAAPQANLAARTVARADAGICVAPDDGAAWIAAARRLAEEPELRRALAGNARQYATGTFDIGAIGARFEDLLREALQETGLAPDRAGSYAISHARG